MLIPYRKCGVLTNSGCPGASTVVTVNFSCLLDLELGDTPLGLFGRAFPQRFRQGDKTYLECGQNYPTD